MTPEDLTWMRHARWWPNGREVRIYAGLVGHDREIVVNIDGYDVVTTIPAAISDMLKVLLPESWYQENRGSRIEVHPSGHFAGGWHPDDVETVRGALEQMGLEPRAMAVP